MGSRGKDPFNFDDIYRQAGVEGLFVKKTMGEMKAKPAAPATGMTTTITKIAAAKPSGYASQYASQKLDLDFLGEHTNSSTAPSLTPQPAPKAAPVPLSPLDLGLLHAQATPPALSHSASNSDVHYSLEDMFGGVDALTTKQPPPSHTAASSDPFAAFEAVDGSSPPVTSAPSSHQPTPASSSADLIGLNTGPAPEPLQRQGGDPSFATVGSPTHVGGLAVHQEHVTGRTPHPAHGFSTTFSEGGNDSTLLPVPSQQLPRRPPPPAPSTYGGARWENSFEEDSLPGAPAAMLRGAGGVAAPGRPPTPPLSYSAPLPPSYSASICLGATSVPDVASAAEEPTGAGISGSGPEAKGLGGMLKGFGKRALKAAADARKQLEDVLEKVEARRDHPGKAWRGFGSDDGTAEDSAATGSSRHSHAQHHRSKGHSGGCAGQTHSEGSRDDNSAEVSGDEALARALSLADMLPNTRREELAKLPRPLRLRVAELLLQQRVIISSDLGYDSSEDSGVVQWRSSSGRVSARSPPRLRPPTRTTASGLSPPAAAPPGSLHRGNDDIVRTKEFCLDDSDGEQYSSTQRRDPAPPTMQPPAYFGVVGASAAAPHGQAHDQPPEFELADHPNVQHHEAHDLLGMDSVTPVAARPAASLLLSFGSEGLAEVHGHDAAVAAPGTVQSFPQESLSGDSGNGFFLGGVPPVTMAGTPAPAAVAAPPPAPAPTSASGPDPTVGASCAAGAAAPPQANAVEEYGDSFFSGGTACAPAGRHVGSMAGAAVMAARSAEPKPTSSYDLSALDMTAAATNQDLYADDDGGPVDGEPELRRQLRAQRLAERDSRMRAALAEKLAKDEAEAARRKEQVDLKDQFKERVDAWRNKNKGNIRGLLSSLQTVLWEGHTWTPLGMGDLLEPNQVKKAYMKANLLVHPDKVRQRNGTAEQVAIADMVFGGLKDAWTVFK